MKKNNRVAMDEFMESLTEGNLVSFILVKKEKKGRLSALRYCSDKPEEKLATLGFLFDAANELKKILKVEGIIEEEIREMYK